MINESKHQKSSELRQRAEELVLNKKVLSPAYLETMASAETRQIVYELHVHQIELELQSEELLREQTKLDAERERYSDLYNLAPLLIAPLVNRD